MKFPFAVPDQGLVLRGHPARSAAYAQAAKWLQTAQGMSVDDAAAVVDGQRVSNDAYWSDHVVADGVNPPHVAGFVGADYPLDGPPTPVTVVCLPGQYLTGGK